MTTTDSKYRIFLSSPGDVSYERSIVREEVKAFFDELDTVQSLQFEIISWDNPDSSSALLANQTPQSTLRRQLVEPADCDLVIVLFWSRMGTPLPKGEFSKANGEPYLSGTEWEFENALMSHSKPNIMLYRRVDRISLDPESASFEDDVVQQKRVSDFFKQFNQDDGTISGYYKKYKGTSEFRSLFVQDLRACLKMSFEERFAGEESKDIKFQPKWRTNPYVGLSPYSEQHAELFFGRARELQQLQEMLSTQPPCISVIGASGTGKSSLILSGLISALKKDHSLGGQKWRCLSAKPSQESIFNELFSKGESQAIDDIVNLFLKQTGAASLLLVLDQAEEMLQLSKQDFQQKNDILRELLGCKKVTVLLTCRTDLYEELVANLDETLKIPLQANTFTLFPPTMTDMIDVIRQPALAAGISVEDKVVGNILEQIEGNTGALPMVSHLLATLYEQVGGSGVFDLSSYDAVGRVEGVVSASAEKVFTSLQNNKEANFSKVFSRLVNIDKLDRVTRNHCELSSFKQDPDCADLVDEFVRARLLTISESTEGTPTLEIAHESLMSNWKRLATLIANQKQQIKLQHQLNQEAKYWQESQHSENRLLRGNDLEVAIDRISESNLELEPLEKQFIDASQRHRLEVQAKIKRVGRLPVVIIAISFISITLFTMLTYRNILFEIEKEKIRSSQIASSMLAIIVRPYYKNENHVMIETTLNAFYDRGDFQMITLTDRHGNTIFKKMREAESSWLFQLLNPSIAKSRDEAYNGWANLGQINVIMSYRRFDQFIQYSAKEFLSFLFILMTLLIVSYLISRRAIKRLSEKIV